jgi:hypothetical protein
MQKRSLILAMIVTAILLPACSSLKVENVNFAWPVESALTVTSSNAVEDVRYGLIFPVTAVAAAEFGDSTALRGTVIRVIRNREGFYFLTGPRFKHVYVLAPREGALVQHASLEVSTTGLSAPALNLRSPYIELLDGNAPARRLTSSEIVEEKK